MFNGLPIKEKALSWNCTSVFKIVLILVLEVVWFWSACNKSLSLKRYCFTYVFKYRTFKHQIKVYLYRTRPRLGGVRVGMV